MTNIQSVYLKKIYIKDTPFLLFEEMIQMLICFGQTECAVAESVCVQSHGDDIPSRNHGTVHPHAETHRQSHQNIPSLR